MLLAIVVFALVGLVVGTAAVAILPAYFPAPRTLTITTGAGSALLGGLIARAVLGPENVAACTAVAAVTAGLLTSVLARPDQVPRGGHRRLRRKHA